MISTHPTADELTRYRDRQSPPDELLRVDQHLATCDSCYAAMGPAAPPIISLPDPAAGGESDHLGYEELERYVDGASGEVEQELVAGHVENCERCRAELDALLAIRDRLQGRRSGRRAETRRRFALPVAAAVVLVAAGVFLFFRTPHRVEPTVNRSVPQAPAPAIAPVVATTAETNPDPAPEEISSRVDEVMRTGRLRRPEVLASLAGDSSPLLGNEPEPVTFVLRSPLVTVVRDQRPTFRWSALKGARSYAITVLDVESQEIAATGTTAETAWRPERPLRRGRIYSWQVTARHTDRTVTAPVPPQPEALFKVADEDLSREVEVLERQLGGSSMSLGVVLAERGFREDAERAFQTALSNGDTRAEKLLREIRRW